MASLTEWKVPLAGAAPRRRLQFRSRSPCLRRWSACIRSSPATPFSADTLGTERAGKWRPDRRRVGADHRLSDHRGRSGSGCISATAALVEGPRARL